MNFLPYHKDTKTYNWLLATSYWLLVTRYWLLDNGSCIYVVFIMCYVLFII